MATRANDLLFGRGSEWNNKGVLEKHLGITLSPMGTYDVFDFVNGNNTVYVELKTRRIPHDRYDTAIIGANKVDWCDDPTKTYWFAYCYTDGIYIIKYDKKVFDTFERKNDFQRGVRSDCPNPLQKIVLIPVSALTPI